MEISAQDLRDVTVKVPADRIADFYAMYGRWLGGERGAEVSQSDQIGNPDNERRRCDSKNDLEDAKEAWKRFPARAKLLFSTLIDKPGQKFSGEELAKLHDIPNGIYGVAGVLSWPGRYLVKLGRPLPFKAEPNAQGGSSYWMDPDLAALFRRARDAS